jgi:hypothetical protein
MESVRSICEFTIYDLRFTIWADEFSLSLCPAMKIENRALMKEKIIKRSLLVTPVMANDY